MTIFFILTPPVFVIVALFELHGNSNLERCDKCGHEYLRDFRCSVGLRNHVTGRKCDDVRCGGNLKDTIIHFGETLPVGEPCSLYVRIMLQNCLYDIHVSVNNNYSNVHTVLN